ncbi:MAG: hypothetical protein A2097_07770 [Desulfobacula sp. GWF2_41_7]|nr:MAG: hypothetical protein A2097_07770 [Desulfobacula sp. GWF2_41_7]
MIQRIKPKKNTQIRMEHLWFHYHDRAVLEDIRRLGPDQTLCMGNRANDLSLEKTDVNICLLLRQSNFL